MMSVSQKDADEEKKSHDDVLLFSLMKTCVILFLHHHLHLPSLIALDMLL
jgi:hypothetical protein